MAGFRRRSGFLLVPGASASVLNVEIPYARAALLDTLSHFGDNATSSSNTNISTACCAQTAELMARASYRQSAMLLLAEASGARKDADLGLAQRLAASRLFGVGCTAALVSASPKKGDHRCHIAVVSIAYGMWNACYGPISKQLFVFM